jgi:hypothetical protein
MQYIANRHPQDLFNSEWVDGTNVSFGNVPKRTDSTVVPWRGGQPDNTRNNADGKEECVMMYPKLGCDSQTQTYYAQWNGQGIYMCSSAINIVIIYLQITIVPQS